MELGSSQLKPLELPSLVGQRLLVRGFPRGLQVIKLPEPGEFRRPSVLGLPYCRFSDFLFSLNALLYNLDCTTSIAHNFFPYYYSKKKNTFAQYLFLFSIGRHTKMRFEPIKQRNFHRFHRGLKGLFVDG